MKPDQEGSALDSRFELVHYEQFGETGSYLFLIHGYMVDSGMYEHMLELYSRHHRVLTIDNRGFGKSAGLEGPYTIDQMTDDVIAVMDHLGIERAFVLGYSKGGLIAQQLAIRYPERLRGIVLAVTFAYKILTAVERMQQRFLATFIKRMGIPGMIRFLNENVAENLTGSQGLKRRDVNKIRKMLGNCRGDVLLQSGYDMFKFDARPHLETITSPTLVVAGKDDLLAPIHHQRLLARSIPGARLKVFDGAGHGLIFTHCEEFINLTLEFFQSVESANASSRFAAGGAA